MDHLMPVSRPGERLVDEHLRRLDEAGHPHLRGLERERPELAPLVIRDKSPPHRKDVGVICHTTDVGRTSATPDTMQPTAPRAKP